MSFLQKQLQKEITDDLKKVGAIIVNSHFVYTPKEDPPGSGNWKWFHGADYISKEEILSYPWLCEKIAVYLALRFTGQKIDVVCGPEHGAINLAHEVAAELNIVQFPELIPQNGIQNIWAEKKDKNQDGTPMVIREVFHKKIAGKNVLAVEDILTSGGSARRMIEKIRRLGGEVVGLGAIANRGNVKPQDVGNVPIVAIIETEMKIYPAKKCPLCDNKIPINTDYGKGREWLMHNKWPKK